MGTPALSPGWLHCGFAQSRSHPAASQRPQLCLCMVLALQGCLVHGLLVKAPRGKVLSTPCSFPRRRDRGSKTSLLLFYISILMTTVNFESILFFSVLLVSLQSFLLPSILFFFSNTNPGNHQ